MSTSKKINIVYRIFVLLTAATVITGFGKLMMVAISTNSDSIEALENVASSLGLVAKCFFGATIGTGICFVMNFAACKSVHVVSVVFRSIFLALALGLQLLALDTAGIIGKMSTAFTKLGTLNGIESISPADIGMTADDITKITNFTNTTDDLAIFIGVLFISSLIYFVFFITSIVSLVTKDRT